MRMVGWGRDRETARSRAWTWPAATNAARRSAGIPSHIPWTIPWPDRFPLADRLRAWGIAETGPGRLLPWLPVAFGLGIIVYFTADAEPQAWAALALALVCASIAILSRRRALGFPLALVATAAACGFATATLKSAWVAQPRMAAAAWNVTVEGFVEAREQRERTDRIVVRTTRVEGPRVRETPERVRVSLRTGTAPPVGSYVTFRARLGPPMPPPMPGGYNFARILHFEGIGASGFVLGAIATAEPAQAGGMGLRYAAAVQSMRDAVDARIRGSIAGHDEGAIASALITGKRDAISAEVNEAMYISSLAHVLSISGYHMAVVAGIVFFALRAVLALVPGFAGRRPIKKWAAAGALVGTSFYLVMSGAEVATQRAYIMTAIVLIGVMADRPALTLRTLAIAALAVMLVSPEAVVHPSFQMSFAATLALVAIYANGMAWAARADTPLAARVALWGGREVTMLVLASVVAGLATMPYAAFHFHRIAPYGVLANLIAMPIVSAWVMPTGLLGLIAMPLGLDGVLWWLMGQGVWWMIVVAQWVAGLPGALVLMPAFGVGPLLVGSGGIVLLCLLRTPLRWCGAVLAIVACVLAVRAPQPDVLIAADGQSVAVRGTDGRFAIRRSSGDAFAVRAWLAADGDGRAVSDPELRGGMRCDAAGCILPLPDGRLVALVLRPEAFAEDCGRAALVVTARNAPPGCKATVVDRGVLHARGAVALRVAGEGFAMQAVRPANRDRPWNPAVPDR